MNWLKLLLPLFERAGPWLARKLFPEQPEEKPDANAARHGAAAGEAARRASREAGK